MKTKSSRRQFLTQISLTAAGLATAPAWGAALPEILLATKPNSKVAGVQLGTITYSFRSMPHDIQQLLQFCVDAGVSAIEMMGDPMETYAGKPEPPFRMSFGPGRPQLTDEQRAQLAEYAKTVAAWRASVSMDKFKSVRKMFKKSGVSIYAYKPNAFGPNNSDAEVDYGMRAAKALGASSITLELPTDPAQSQRLGNLGAKNGVYVGYHNHLQATETLWDEALKQSPYNTINLDAGHYWAVGGKNTETLLNFIRKHHSRITSMHLKDRTTPDLGQGNLEWGKGNTPIRDILTLIRDNQYKFPVTIELEYQVPEGSDAVKEVKKCVDYARKILLNGM